MTRKLIKIILFLVIPLTCSVAHAKQPSAILETDLFILNFPEDIKLLQIKSERNEIDFTYAYIEPDKERKKSILLVITGEDSKIITKHYMKSALYAATNVLRERKTSCNGKPTEIVETSIGNNMALYFEKNNKDCILTVEKYWSVVRGSNFIFFYISKPTDGNNDVFDKVQTMIRQVKFK